ncbi:branched-chain amino acid ABC transporter permease [Castellaniella sp. GW247-6E4]|uniref:branched-chain amino acid ABC transporter permease n=1 Tax=Castellaniella sp. GW247-6E4 TaxID=3140380 RepID=UPI003314EB8F
MHSTIRDNAGNHSILKKHSGDVLTFFLTLAIFTIPVLWRSDYIIFIASLFAVHAIIVMALNITNGYMGMLNLSVAGQVGLGAYAAALLAEAGLSLPSVIIATMMLGALVGAFIFLIFCRLSGFFLGLGTIAAAEAIRLLIRNFDGITGGMRGLGDFPPIAGDNFSMYILACVSCLVVFIMTTVLVRSEIGLRWRAVRENEGKAKALGFNVFLIKLSTFTFVGAIMTFGGGLLALIIRFIDPNIAGLNYLIEYVIMLAAGGPGTIVGPLLGSFFITVVPEVLRVAPEFRMIIYGAVLILLVLRFPGGIAGIFTKAPARSPSEAKQNSSAG